MKISACLIVKNEEHNLPRCLNSVKRIVDEYIVVDTGSTDQTKQVAASFGAKVFDFLWNNDFSAAKNEALAQAGGDWIIFLDADEYLQAGDDQKLYDLLLKNNENKDIESVACSMVDFDTDKQIVMGRTSNVRVFRNLEDIRYVGKVHEEPRKKNAFLKSLSTDAITIIHTGYSSSVIKAKFNRNLNLLLEIERDGAADVITYYYLSTCYEGLNMYTEAIEYAEKVFQWEKENKQRLRPSVRHQLYIILLRSMINLGPQYSLEETNDVLEEALKEYGYHPEIVWYQATILLREKKIQAALKGYLQALELHKNHHKNEINNFANYLTETYVLIGSLYTYLNQEEKALDYLVQAIKTERYHENALIRLLRLFQQQKPEEIIVFLQSIYDKSSYQDVEFIIKVLMKVKLPIVLGYYAKIWNTTFEQQDQAIIEAMLALGKYGEVAETVLLMAEQHGQYSALPLACAAILLSSLDEAYRTRIANLNKAAAYALTLLDEPTTPYILSDEIRKTLLETMPPVMAYAKEDLVCRYVDRALEVLPETDAYALLDAFMAFGKLKPAQYYYEMISAKAVDSGIRNRSLFMAGFCAYRQRKYESALKLFAKAAVQGHHDPEILECLALIEQQCADEKMKKAAADLHNQAVRKQIKLTRLHLGCGKDIKKDWLNLDIASGEGIDIVADLDECAHLPLPLEEDTVDEFLAGHVIEHLKNPLPMMQELHRIAKPGAKAVFRCPYGSSDDAFDDPTHQRQYFLSSFGYFSQPFYWRADYGYRGDWKVEKITLFVESRYVRELNVEKVLEDVHTKRNIVKEMMVELTAVKPIRPPDMLLQSQPKICFFGI